MSASSPSKASATNSSPDPCRRHDTPHPPLSASLPPSRHSTSVFAPVPAAVPTHIHLCLCFRPCPHGILHRRIRYSTHLSPHPPLSLSLPPPVLAAPILSLPSCSPHSHPSPPFLSRPLHSASVSAANTTSVSLCLRCPTCRLYRFSPSSPCHCPPLSLSLPALTVSSATSTPFRPLCRHPSRPCPCCHPCHHLHPFRLRPPPNQQPDCPSPECTHSQLVPQQIPTACPTQSRNHPPADSIFLFRALHDRLPQQKTPFHSRKNHIPRKR